MMKTLKLAIEGAYLLQFSRYNDERGYLEEIYNHEAFPLEIAQHFPVKQNTVSRSKKHVLRGIHISPYAKLITCVSGAIYDVVVDLRPESSTYLRWAAVELTEENCKQLFVPPLCGHAFYSLSENSTIIYCQSDCFDKSLKTERAVSLFDPVLDIFWPKPKDVTCIISKKDQTALNLDCSELHIAPKRKRILIIGASGQVGGVLFEAIGKRSEKYIAVGTYGQHAQNGLVQFDMEAAAKDIGECSVLLTMCHPAVVCVCAAFTWVDGCEKFAEKSETVNVKAVSNICACAKEIGAKIVYFSSDYVFDGVCGQNTATCEEKLSEDSGTNPVNRYGKQKVEAEKTVLSTDSKNLVIRTSRIFGPATQGKNFVYAVVKNVLTKQRVKCLKDEISCPTYSRDLANTTMTLIDTDSSGIFHCTGPEYLSKADWGRKICRYFNLDESYVEDVSMCGEAKRPKFVAMDCSKTRNILSDNFHCQSFESAMNHWKNNAFGDKSIFSAGKV